MSPLFHISQAGEKNPLPQSPWIVAWIPSSQKISMKSPYQIIIGEAPERHVCWLKKSHEYCIPVKNTPSVNQVLCVNKNPIGSPRFLVSLFFYGFSYALWFSRRATSCFCCPKPPPAAPWPSFAAPSAVPRRRLSSSRVRWNLERFRDIIPQIWWVHPKMWWFMGLFSWIYGNHPQISRILRSSPKMVISMVFFPWIHIHLQFGEVLKSGELSQKMFLAAVHGFNLCVWTDHGSHSKPEQDVRNLEPLLLLGCKASDDVCGLVWYPEHTIWIGKQWLTTWLLQYPIFRRLPSTSCEPTGLFFHSNTTLRLWQWGPKCPIRLIHIPT